MKQNKYIFVCMMLVSISILATIGAAHPPQDMVLEYDLETSTLEVTITHNTPGPTLHYVNKIDIEKNGELYLSEDYDSQPTTASFTYSYTVEASIGDELKVTAYCNIQGSISKSLTVRDPSQDEAPVVEIANPTKGYFHFSGIRLFPTTLDLLADTASIGGFRLDPIRVYTDDDVDDPPDLEVKIFIDGEERGTAQWNSATGYHEWKWTGWGLGTYRVKATAEDSSGNTGFAEMDIWYFCFIP